MEWYFYPSLKPSKVGRYLVVLRQFLTHDAYVTEAGWQRGVNGSGAWSHDDYNCDIQEVEMWTYMPAVPTSAKRILANAANSMRGTRKRYSSCLFVWLGVFSTFFFRILYHSPRLVSYVCWLCEYMFLNIQIFFFLCFEFVLKAIIRNPVSHHCLQKFFVLKFKLSVFFFDSFDIIRRHIKSVRGNYVN